MSEHVVAMISSRDGDIEMKKTIGIWTTALALFFTLGLAEAYAAPAPHSAYGKTVELTGCLQQGPTAKEYMIENNDGVTWGVNEADLYLNHYVGRNVTIAGSTMPPTSAERKDGGAHHYMEARDVAVNSQHCQ